ncbi:MAG: Trehalose/maltose import ATP-binding protein MalK [Methanobacterium sp. PtaU1.Bin242]|nr:MAG: Trehalose/maltose import ATP-binding protein MalK [Methanobacterium sp. PtaU1.Bin242]
MDTVIKTYELTKKFGHITAVNSINLEIYKGETLALLGPNGAGKTTFISMLSTLVKSTSGTATLCNIDINRDPLGVRKKIGIVFQEPSTDDLLTARENLYLHSMLYGLNKNEINKKIDEIMGIVGLYERKDDFVRTFSGGMRRRLEIARGLLHEPQVLFLDEPTLGLDPSSRKNIWQYIKYIKEKNKTTIILTTHYMEEADLLSDRIAIIDYGKIVALDTPNNLKNKLGRDIVILKGDISEEIKKLDFVLNVENIEHGCKITLKDINKNLKELINKAGSFEEIEIRRVSLEDVFFKFTGHKIEEGKENNGIFETIARYKTTGK